MMTQEEIELIKITTELWNKYVKLPIQHPCDQEEFCRALHICQQLIMIRKIRRDMPTLFPTYNENVTSEIEKEIENGFKD